MTTSEKLAEICPECRHEHSGDCLTCAWRVVADLRARLAAYEKDGAVKFLLKQNQELREQRAGLTAELKQLLKIAALCWEEMEHGLDLPSDVFDAVEKYYERKRKANSQNPKSPR